MKHLTIFNSKTLSASLNRSLSYAFLLLSSRAINSAPCVTELVHSCNTWHTLCKRHHKHTQFHRWPSPRSDKNQPCTQDTHTQTCLSETHAHNWAHNCTPSPVPHWPALTFLFKVPSTLTPSGCNFFSLTVTFKKSAPAQPRGVGKLSDLVACLESLYRHIQNSFGTLRN